MYSMQSEAPFLDIKTLWNLCGLKKIRSIRVATQTNTTEIQRHTPSTQRRTSEMAIYTSEMARRTSEMAIYTTEMPIYTSEISIYTTSKQNKNHQKPNNSNTSRAIQASNGFSKA